MRHHIVKTSAGTAGVLGRRPGGRRGGEYDHGPLCTLCTVATRGPTTARVMGYLVPEQALA